MLIAFPVLPLLASTMVSPGRSSPSRSARSIMYLAMRALIDPEGFRYSSLTQIPSTMISGVLPIASRIEPPPGRTSPAAGSRAPPAAERAPLMAFMTAPYARVCADDPDPPALPHRIADCRLCAGRPRRDSRHTPGAACARVLGSGGHA